MIKRKQLLGILGVCFAIGGGIVWIFNGYPVSAILWGIAVIIILRLKKSKPRSKKR